MSYTRFYGFTPTLARFCRWVRDAGFRVYAPILFGSPDAGNAEKQTLGRILSLCVSREFTLLAGNKSSPVTEWLRALARLAHEECGGPGTQRARCARARDRSAAWLVPASNP